jgi:uncharacterized membrane protein YecN with MAPEG domain
MNFAVTGIYASLLAVLMLVLSLRVSIHRFRTNISILHGGDMSLAQTIRHHGNMTEYVPIALILMGIAEAQGAGGMFLHAIGAVLLVSRLIHPFGVRHGNPMLPPRAIGHFGTFASMLLAIGYILWKALS